jgi:hypothetical protein
MNLQQAFIAQLKKTFKGLESQSLEGLISENLISPFGIRLPKSVLSEILNSIDVLFRLRENETYQASYQQELVELNIQDPGNKSICMSYDFHVTSDNHIKLIEVNTNASFLALGYEMYKMKGLALPVADFSYDEIRSDIETELRLFGRATVSPKVAIIDEEPEKQRLYAEFLDIKDLNTENIDFIYNRYTDFFLNHPISAELKKAFTQKQSCFSPNPYEYFLLADKQRMIDWSDSENLNKWQLSAEDQAVIQAVVPSSLSLEPNNKEHIWAQRKGYFIKPKRAFGAKQSYRGASISRKAFDELVGQDFIAQGFVPAPEQVFKTPEGEINFKYDLRCYAYQGRLQLVVARLYQGQVTNLRTPLGGFACVEFS